MEERRLPEFGDCDELLCPCGGTNLHQQKVIAHHAPNEDGDGVCVTVEQNGQTTLKGAPRATFVGRRNDLAIEFACEQCGRKWVFRIWQHKGFTFMSWDDHSPSAAMWRENEDAQGKSPVLG